MVRNYLPSVILGILGLVAAYYVVEIFRLHWESKQRRKEFEWNLQQLARGLVLINSKSEKEILTGLEILYAINHPARLKALPRLAKLASDDNIRIATQATKLIEVFSRVSVELPKPRESRRIA
jgi:hypothetical protein